MRLNLVVISAPHSATNTSAARLGFMSKLSERLRGRPDDDEKESFECLFQDTQCIKDQELTKTMLADTSAPLLTGDETTREEGPHKRRIRFSPTVSVGMTYSPEDYDRTCTNVSPLQPQDIREIQEMRREMMAKYRQQWYTTTGSCKYDYGHAARLNSVNQEHQRMRHDSCLAKSLVSHEDDDELHNIITAKLSCFLRDVQTLASIPRSRTLSSSQMQC